MARRGRPDKRRGRPRWHEHRPISKNSNKEQGLVCVWVWFRATAAMDKLNGRRDPLVEVSMQQVETPPGSSSPSAPARPRAAPVRPEARQLPSYSVRLHNDDVNEMGYVVRTIRQLTPLSAFRAARVMLEAHYRGSSRVLVTHKERAELYREQFRSKGLTTTIEPAS
jgi:ATP-dependent Clp protease adaptor protein ClpS